MANAHKVLLPNIELNMDSVTVVDVLVQPGDSVKKGTVLLTVESQKATFEVESDQDGFVSEIMVAVNDEICEKAHLCTITDTKEAMVEDSGTVEPTAAGAGLSGDEPDAPEINSGADSAATDAKDANYEELTKGKVRASPLARKMAKEHGLDLHALEGSGPRGRIMRRDIEGALSKSIDQVAQDGSTCQTVEKVSVPSSPSPGIVAPKPSAETSVDGADWQAFSASRLAMIKQMEAAVISIPIFSLSRQIDLTAISRRTEGITLTHRLVACLGRALVEFPSLRTTVRQGDFRVEPVAVAVAMDTKQGLSAPAVRHPERMTLPEISATVKLLKARGDAGQLKRTDFERAPFALSNLGMYGVDQFQPSIFEGQAAVLGAGRAIDGAGGRKLAWFTLSCDHRIVDGAEAARFLQTLQELVLNAENL